MTFMLDQCPIDIDLKVFAMWVLAWQHKTNTSVNIGVSSFGTSKKTYILNLDNNSTIFINEMHLKIFNAEFWSFCPVVNELFIWSPFY